eukprot:117033_1
MGNTQSKEINDEPQSLKLYDKLLTMGFEDKISFEAAHKFKNNFDKAVEYILKYKEKTKKSKIFNSRSIEKQIYYVERITFILFEYQKFIQQRNKRGIYELIVSNYPNNNSISSFLMDYHLFVTNIDNKQYFEDNKCNINKCNYVKRGYRCSKIDNNIRKQLYHGQTDEINIALSQILDSTHNILYHSFDMGFRVNINKIDEKNDNNNNDSVFSVKLENIKKILAVRTKDFNAIRPDLNDNKSNDIKVKTFSKFVIDNEYNDEEEKKDNNKHQKFDFGKRYYYHKYYKNNKTVN